MKIGFIFPNKDRRYKTMHLGLAYLASYARTQHDDLSFEVLDTRTATRKETRKFFNTSFDVVGITVFSPVYFEVIENFNRIKATYPNVPIVLGGPYVTTIQEEVFEETPADFAVYGEGEITFSELIGHLKGNKNADEIKGLMIRSSDGKIQKNPPRPYIKNLDEIPQPAYDIYNMDRYPLHRMVTSRGCPFSCAWCNSTSLWNFSYRARSPENILSEIEYLIKNHRKKIFVFGDNTFNVDHQRVDEFCDLLIERNIDILWSVSIRADLLTQELAYKMRKSGCYNVSVGVESANNEILSHISKSLKIDKTTQGIEMLKKAGIEIMSQYVIGSPHDTLETVKESIEYARHSPADYVNFYSVLPFKGTPQWDWVKKNGKLYTDKIHEFHQIEPRIVFETPEFSYGDRLEAIKLAKKNGFYSNQDKKSFWFDIAKSTTEKLQKMMPAKMGEWVYMILKSVYKMRLVKKHNM